MMQYLKLAFENLRHRKKRAYLTIVGVFIGIMAVVALVSLGEGLKAGVNEQFSKLGVDKVFVQPSTVISGSAGGTAAAPIGKREVNRIQGVPGVQEVVGIKMRSAKIDWSDTTVYETVYEIPQGTDERRLVIETFTIEVEQGRELEGGDRSRVLIGSSYTDRVRYADPLAIGRTVTINNASATVVGILKKTGDPGTDNGIYLPTDLFDQAYPTATDEHDYIIVRTAAGESPPLVAERIKDSLRHLRNVKVGDEDFSVQTTDDIKESFDAILGIIQVVLTGIALISLIVGAVGIMNTMYTAVLERTKEIGIMKAIGARNEEILAIFLLESGMLGLIGGAVGCVLGLGISYLASIIAAAALGSNIIKFVVPWWLIVGALAFGMIIGALAGFFPARAAAKQKPVDSLRYE